MFPQCAAFTPCLPGFLPSEDRNECVDTDECANGACHPQASCLNTPGSYSCHCDVAGGLPGTCHEFSVCSGNDCFCGTSEHGTSAVVAATMERLATAQQYKQMDNPTAAQTSFQQVCNEKYLMELDCMRWNQSVRVEMGRLYGLSCSLADNSAKGFDVADLRSSPEVRPATFLQYQAKIAALNTTIQQLHAVRHPELKLNIPP